MPLLPKPCPGQFSEETIAALTSNENRAQWLDHPCTLCGQQIGARIEKGKWIPEQHWASVQYKERTRRTPKGSSTTASRTLSQTPTTS
jgi:hypothetical protein